LRALPAAAAVVLAGAISAAGALAQQPPWSVYGGGFNFRWQTDGGHGHTEACREPACDDADWRRGNLDNAIGWRLGAERALLATGRLRLTAGAELDLAFTEYNQSQSDFIVGALLATGGVDVALGPVRPILRLGAGGAAARDARGGGAWFVEGGLEVPLGGGAALRLSTRRAGLGGPRLEDASLVFVATPGEPREPGGWSLGWAWGGSEPGGVVGDDLALGRAPLWRLAAFRAVGRHGDRLGFHLGATSHESTLYSYLGNVPGNQRGKWVIDLGGGWQRVLAASQSIRWRAGAGARVASWFDEDNPFLVDDGGDTVKGTWEVAGTIIGGADLRLGEGLWLTAELEQSYWPSLDLGELRLLVGIEVTP